MSAQTHHDTVAGFRLTGKKVLAILIGFFGVIAAVNAVMAYLAINTFSGLQTLRPYEAGVKFNDDIARARLQDDQHWTVDTHVARSADGTVVLKVALADRQGLAITECDLSVSLVSPVASRLDAVFTLTADGPGRYRGITQAAAGQWDLVIVAKHGAGNTTDPKPSDGTVFRSVNRVTLH